MLRSTFDLLRRMMATSAPMTQPMDTEISASKSVVPRPFRKFMPYFCSSFMVV